MSARRGAAARGLSIAAAVVMGAVATCRAADPGSPVHINGLQSQPSVTMPSATRVTLAAVVTIALAAGTIVLLKRFLPKIPWRVNDTGGAIKVLARADLARTLRLHLVEIDTSRVLIVEGRTGIELAVLPRSGGEPQART